MSLDHILDAVGRSRPIHRLGKCKVGRCVDLGNAGTEERPEDIVRLLVVDHVGVEIDVERAEYLADILSGDRRVPGVVVVHRERPQAPLLGKMYGIRGVGATAYPNYAVVAMPVAGALDILNDCLETPPAFGLARLVLVFEPIDLQTVVAYSLRIEAN